MASVVDEALNVQNGGHTKCPDKVIIRAASRRIRDDKVSARQLREDGIEIPPVTLWSLWLAAKIGTRHIGAAIAVVLVVSLFTGVATGCHSGSRFIIGCQNTTFRETKSTVGDLSTKRAAWPRSSSQQAQAPANTAAVQADAGNTGAGALGNTSSGESLTMNLGSETSDIERHQLAGARFNIAAFQACLLVCTFILAFSRWMIENRHSSMSELFERKKEVNLLLLKDEKGIFQPLISEALEPVPKDGGDVEAIKGADCRAYLDRAAKAPCSDAFARSVQALMKRQKMRGTKNFEAKTEDNTEFLRQMFVYIELDNFELAFNRYVAGLLAPEQMNRAREIIESRCANRTFRYLATVQGLKYYTESFHWALMHILIRTEYIDRGPLESANDGKAQAA